MLASTHDTSAALGEIDATVRHILNGTLSARVPLFEDRQLWHVANGLNYVFARLERYSESEATLQRTQRQVVVVVEGIRTMRAGGIPLWPRPARTPLDAIVAELAPENEPDVLDSASRYSFPIPTEHNSEAAYDG